MKCQECGEDEEGTAIAHTLMGNGKPPEFPPLLQKYWLVYEQTNYDGWSAYSRGTLCLMCLGRMMQPGKGVANGEEDGL